MTLTRLSDSAMSAAKDCKRKYYFRCVKGLQKRRDYSPALHYGKLWHRVLARWFQLRSLDGMREFIQALAFDNDATERCMAMLTGYLARWPELPWMSLHEQPFEVPIRNPATGRPSQRFTQFGFVDMLPDSRVLWEHKTASQVDGNYLEKLWSDSQITGYVAALRDIGIDVRQVLYDVAVKPRLRQKKKETTDEFYERIADWHLTEPTAYRRETVYISDRQIQDWREDTWQTTQELLAARRSGYWPRNTRRCYDYFRPCEFVPLCQNGASEALINAEYEPRVSPANDDKPELKTPF